MSAPSESPAASDTSASHALSQTELSAESGSTTSPTTESVTSTQQVTSTFTFNFSNWAAPSQAAAATPTTTTGTTAAPAISVSFGSTSTPSAASVALNSVSPSTDSVAESAAGASSSDDGWFESEYKCAEKIMQNTLASPEERQQMQEWFKRGAAAGHVPSMYEAGAYLISKAGEDQEQIAEGMKLIEEASQKGYAHALRYLGMCVVQGINGQTKSRARGETLLEQALELGDGFAGHNLACHLQRRLENATTKKLRNELLARIEKAYRRGAELGDPTCQHNLACALADGEKWVGKKDDAEALHWELQAARTNTCVGSRAANYNLGQWYSLGLYGLKADVNRAIEYWERASTAESYHNLACLYDPRFADQVSMRIAVPSLHPQLPPFDEAKTKHYLEQGAKLGNPRSEVMLGFAYQKGEIGCECSPDFALYLYYRARRRGSAQAVERLQLYLQSLVMVVSGEIDMDDVLFSISGKLEFCRMLLPVTDGGPQYFETNFAAAARLLTQLVEKDDSAEAMVELAKLLSALESSDNDVEGDEEVKNDVERDVNKAKQLLHKAADKGNEEAREILRSLDNSHVKST